jgi:DNA polymerase-3 subunit alpha
MLFGAPAAPKESAVTATGMLVDEWPEAERLQREKESLGFYLSGHPFEKRGAFLRRVAGHTTASAGSVAGGETVRIAGMVSSVRVLQIKQGKNAGQKMARFQLEDLDGTIGVTCFARAYQRHKDRIIDDAIVFLSGRIDEKSEERALLLDEIEPANEVVRREVSGLVLLLRGLFVSDSTLARIAAICEQHRGNQSLHLDVEEEGHVHRVRCDASIQVSDALLDEFALVVGPENMSFTRR